MRWVEHWTIAKDALAPRKSPGFQLGSILPDYFERKPIHRWRDNRELFLEKVDRVCKMPPGFRRDWQMGTLAHYICDYCCMAHNDEYYRYYRHRVYEVLSQKFFKRQRRSGGTDIYRIRPQNLPAVPEPSGDLRTDTAGLVEAYVKTLHERIAAFGSTEWFRDERCMDLDIRYAYGLLRAALVYWGEEEGAEHV